MRKFRTVRAHLVGAIVTAMLLAAGHAQTADQYKPVGTLPSQTSSIPAQAALPSAGSESLLIGRGDLVTVMVYGEPDMTQQVRVTDSGEIPLLIGGSVHVAGLTPEAASQAISDHLREAHIFNNARVSLLVQEYATEGASVFGEVARPGIVPLTTSRRIIDIVSLVGGLTPIADRHVTIQHGTTGSETVFLSNDPKLSLESNNVLVNPGDTVIVPRAGIVYVLGDVARPGGYVMQNESRMTLLQAVAISGGANNTAAKSHARLIRKTNGQYADLPFNLKDIENGKQPDVQLAADDVLYLPFSLGRHILLGTGSIIPAVAGAAIYATIDIYR